jgi:hypothetical protein
VPEGPHCVVDPLPVGRSGLGMHAVWLVVAAVQWSADGEVQQPNII